MKYRYIQRFSIMATIMASCVSVACASNPYPSDDLPAGVKAPPVINSPKKAPAAIVNIAGPKLPSGPVGALIATNLDGTTVDLSSAQGYKVIYFFSIGCPCVRDCEKLSFKPLYEKYQGKVAFYAVTSGGWDLADERSNFVSLANTHQLPFPIVLDPTHSIADKLGGTTASQAILLDPENRIIFSGAADDSKEQRDQTGKAGITKSYLAGALDQSMAGKPVAVSFVRPKGCSIAK